MNWILETLSLPNLQAAIQVRLGIEGLRSHPFIHTYFVCSDSGRIGDFRGEDKQKLLQKFRTDRGVTVDLITQSHGNQKEQQVDMSVVMRMLEMGPLAVPHYDPWRHVVLISSDSDYVPAIRLLSTMATHTITVGFRELKNNQTGTVKKYPIELINESYLFLEMSELILEMENRNNTL